LGEERFLASLEKTGGGTRKASRGRVFHFEQTSRQVLLQAVVMRIGLPMPDLRKLDNYGLSGHRAFDLLVRGKEALAERGK
jgi:hypothetical protein